ncbi:MAG: sensor histidine kinase [Clostridiales bacterium]|nr:sensor histidine kinase [Clostridiales bacterium]
MWTNTPWRSTSPVCGINSGMIRISSCGPSAASAIWEYPGRTGMRKTDVKKEKPPVRLLGTMFLLVLGLVAVYVVLALGIFALVQKLVHLDETNYTLLWPILILSVSAILGVLLAVFIFRGYLAPLSRLMQATQSVAAGDYSVRVEMRGARGEVAEYIRSFNKMAEELSSVALLRMDFVNTFSHEFKTPLISIRGFAKLLQNDDLTPQQRQTYTDTVVQQSERLAAMSTHILELAQYENTEIVSGKAVYSLDEQLRRCVRQQERDWLKKGLTVEGDLDRVDYYGNEELAEHIWSNLLSNAIRFTPSGGQITIVLRQGEGEVTVSVSDTGIGMDEDTQQHIFDKFYRAAPYSDIRGNGLGLSIVRRAVALCGGQIAVFSRPGKGSTFTVTLPAAQE